MEAEVVVENMARVHRSAHSPIRCLVFVILLLTLAKTCTGIRRQPVIDGGSGWLYPHFSTATADYLRGEKYGADIEGKVRGGAKFRSTWPFWSAAAGAAPGREQYKSPIQVSVVHARRSKKQFSTVHSAHSRHATQYRESVATGKLVGATLMTCVMQRIVEEPPSSEQDLMVMLEECKNDL